MNKNRGKTHLTDSKRCSRLIGLMLAALVTLVGLTSCAYGGLSAFQASHLPVAGLRYLSPPPEVTEIAANYPLVDGSTSADPLRVLIACKILGRTCRWVSEPFLSREKRILPELSDDVSKETVQRAFGSSSGTHSAYMALINGGTDIILVARRPSLDELMAASKAEEVLDVVPIALDAFVFLANSANPMASLSSEQIRAIYSGQVTDWAQVGGAPGPIRAFQRDRNSGSQELMEEMVMKGAAMVEAPDMLLETMSGPINAIGTEIWGIGYSVYYYATVMLPDPKVKLLAINGVTPSADTIRDGSYPLTTEVYAVILRESPWAPHIGGGRQGRPDRTSARILRDWLLTPAGQEVVVESGYVPLLVVNPSGQAASRLFVADQLRTPQAS